MGSGGSKPKPKQTVQNKTNNSNLNDDKPSSTPQTQSNPGTEKQTQVPPTSEKLPPIVKKDEGTSSEKSKPDKNKDPANLPSLTSTDTSDVQKQKTSNPEQDSPNQDKNSEKPKTTTKTEETAEAKDEIKGVKVPEVEEKIIEEDPVDQKKFDSALRCACLLVKPESIYKHVTKNVTKLHLPRALPQHFSLETLLSKFDHLQDLDLSHNNLGPQGFRAVCLAICGNSTILSLNLADNKSDTDSADCLGRLVEENQILEYLDVSSNYLGKDYFSRRVGPALKTNKTLKTLRCESIGTTDARLLIEGLQENTSLVELDISQNELSDKVGFAKGLAASLKREGCTLKTLCLSRVGFNSAGITEMIDGLNNNKSLEELNLSGSEFSSLDVLLQLTLSAIRHPSLYNLCLDNSTVKSQDISTECPVCENVSVLQILSLNSCGLSDTFFTSLLKSCEGKLLSLVEVDIASNEKLSVACIESLMKLTSTNDQPSSLRKISYGLNKADEIPGLLSKPELRNLSYISLRMCRMSAESVGEIAKCWNNPDSHLSTLILDGLKLSATPALKMLLANPKSCKLTTLSLGGCQLDDNDLSPLVEALKGGLSIHMLKLSANRITDVGVASLVDGLLKNKAGLISVLDLSNNRITDEGVKSLVKLFGSKSKLNSLNVSSNNIGKDGLVLLSGLLNSKSSLQSLHAQGQTTGLDEPHMIEIYNKLASSLGYKVQMEGEKIKPGCSDLPNNIPERLLVNFTNLGGQTGSIGQALDSPCIQTDRQDEKLPYLTLNHVFTICCYLKGHKSDVCVWSEKDWDMITGADRPTTDSPSWLKLPEARTRCIYMCNLPGNTTQQKIDAILEMDADCNLEEACLMKEARNRCIYMCNLPGNTTQQKIDAILEMDADCNLEEACHMKDPVTRSVNGCGWAVMADIESVQKALDLFNDGEAKIFGQPFLISDVKIKVDNEVSSQLEKTAAADRETRLKERAKAEASHRNLIITTTEAQWKRHAYRLAHPAYADGRIW